MLNGFLASHTRKAGTTQPGEEKACGHPVTLYTYVKGGGRENGARVFAPVLVKGQEVMGTKRWSFPWNIGKHLFTLRVMEHWRRSP